MTHTMVTLESTIEKEFASVLAAINRGSSKDVLEKENKTEATIHMQECLDRALAELESVNCQFEELQQEFAQMKLDYRELEQKHEALLAANKAVGQNILQSSSICQKCMTAERNYQMLKQSHQQLDRQMLVIESLRTQETQRLEMQFLQEVALVKSQLTQQFQAEQERLRIQVKHQIEEMQGTLQKQACEINSLLDENDRMKEENEELENKYQQKIHNMRMLLAKSIRDYQDLIENYEQSQPSQQSQQSHQQLKANSLNQSSDSKRKINSTTYLEKSSISPYGKEKVNIPNALQQLTKKRNNLYLKQLEERQFGNF